MNANDCYYTFSTVAQTLAGAFGFLVAAYLYRLPPLLRELESLENRASSYRGIDLSRFSYPLAWPDLLVIADQIRNAPIEDDKVHMANPVWLFDQTRDRFVAGVDRASKLMIHMKRALHLTVGAIALPLVSLPFSSRADIADPFNHTVFAAAALVSVGLSLLCLASYYPIARGLTD
jgi:hypothetical protein